MGPRIIFEEDLDILNFFLIMLISIIMEADDQAHTYVKHGQFASQWHPNICTYLHGTFIKSVVYILNYTIYLICLGQKGVQNGRLLFQFLLIKNIRFQQQQL